MSNQALQHNCARGGPRAFPGRVVFDHLPKTGGSAVNAWIDGALGSGCVSPHLDGEHADLIRHFGGQFSVLCGHVSFCQAEGLDPRYQYVTLFRDPLDRLVSWLYFVATNHADDELMGLVPLVRRFLDSDGADLDDALRPHVENHYVSHFCRVLGDGRESDQQRYDNAVTAVTRYDVVGLHDAMPRFLADLAGLLGMPAPAAIARTNVTRARPALTQLSNGLRTRLLALNALDIRLVDAVRAWQGPDTAPGTAVARWQPFARAPARSVRDAALQLAPPVLREGAGVVYGGALHFDLDFALARDVPRLLVGIHVRDGEGRLAYGTNSGMLDQVRDGLAAGSHSLTFALHATLPTGKYSAGFAFVELLADGGERELAWHEAMCSFEVHAAPTRPAIGYADLAASMAVDAASQACDDGVLTHTPGRLRALAPPATLRAGDIVEIDVELVNDSQRHWRSGRRLPVRLAYHWLAGDGQVRVFEGLRSALPAHGLAPGASCTCRVQVAAPAQGGDFVLVLTALQEHVGWFEAMGFTPARVDVRVADKAGAIGYPWMAQSGAANDSRKAHQDELAPSTH